VQQDYSEAARLARLAAEQGYPPAETDLGFLYEHGKGVPLDYVSAYSWYSKAIEAGEASAREYRRKLAGVMTPKQIEAAKAFTPTVRAPVQAVGPSSSSTFSLVGPSSH
jgi:TPR repeat protein